ncbi:hypothetical protein KKH36_02575 [Patescibacteria group bacterium]|nr:hypothetical protein [Patescibacteria group bacterium]
MKIRKNILKNIFLIIFTFVFFIYIINLSSYKLYRKCYSNFQIELQQKTNSIANLINSYDILGAKEMEVINNRRANLDKWSEESLNNCRNLVNKYNIYPLPIAIFSSIIFFFILKLIIYKFFIKKQ